MGAYWKEHPFESILRRLLIAIVLVVFLAPIVLIILTSLKTRIDALARPPAWIFKPTLSNYMHIFTTYSFGLYFRNSLIAGSAATALSLILGSLAAYGLARYPFRRSGAVSLWILSLRMTPAVSSIIPLFILLRTVGLLDNVVGLVLVYTVMNLPFVVWMMQGFFEDVPVDIEESALVDGCSRLGAFFRVAVPLAAPGLSATAILTFIFTWNEFLFALILTSRNAQTLPVAVTLFMRQTGIDWGYMTAGASVMMLPMLISTFFIQRGLVRGLTLGAIK